MVARAVAVVVLLTLGTAGCGDDSDEPTATGATTTPARTVDDQQVEQGIRDSLTTSSAKVAKVSCPGDVPVQTGDTFTCSVTYSNDATGKVKVTQQGAGRYTYELKPGSVQIPGSELEAQIKKDLAAQGAPDASVNCPDTIIVKVGTTVTCSVSGASGVASGSVTYTFSSDTGDGSVETG